ncbi:MAG TPA: divalent metal cation transporter, partial [Anaerolineae bacterium]
LVYDLNGILLPVILILMIRLANDRRLMGNFVSGRLANGLAWATALLLIVLTALLVLGPLVGFQ